MTGVNFFFALLFFLLAVALFFGGLFVSRLVAPKRPPGPQQNPYECGETPYGSARIQFKIGYYVFALLFLVFDVEAAFLYPWAVVLREVGIMGLVEALIFAFVLFAGLIYAWKKGALEWV